MKCLRAFLIAGLALLVGALQPAPVGAQAISKETIDRLNREVQQLSKQVSAANAFVKEKTPVLKEQEKLIATAPADTDKMIQELEALVDNFKAGSEVAVSVQRAMQEIKVYRDRFREGSDAQKLAAKSLQQSLETFEKSDADRDTHVGNALAAIRKLKAQRDDLIALRIAGAYQVMAQTYSDMITTFGQTVGAAEGVVKSIERAATAPPQ